MDTHNLPLIEKAEITLRNEAADLAAKAIRSHSFVTAKAVVQTASDNYDNAKLLAALRDQKTPSTGNPQNDSNEEANRHEAPHGTAGRGV